MAYSEADYLDLTLTAAQRQWVSIRARRPVSAGKRQVRFEPVETLLCLAAMYLVDHSRFGSSTVHRAPEPVHQLSRLFRRPPPSILAKMANLDGSRSHGAKFDLLAGVTLRADPSRMANTYRVVLAGARSAGIGQGLLPDFLELEEGGDLHMLGQEELARSSVERALDAELRRWQERTRDQLSERDTERLMLVAVRTAQHRFARRVHLNCGGSCVFCGFEVALEPGSPNMLRASHIKPWRDSDDRERLDVTNGLAACPTHDAGFDSGLLTVDIDLTVRRSTRLRTAMMRNEAVRRVFGPDAVGSTITLPEDATAPGRGFIEWHQAHVFAA